MVDLRGCRRLFAVLSASLFLATGSLRALVITEVSYNPGAGGSPADVLEFVEIFNDSPVPFDLSGCYFSKGIELTFPEGTYLGARQALAVCASVAAVRAKFPEANLIGDFQGKLDNGGETIELVNPSGSPLARMTYRDRGDWPATTDGTGFTLSLLSPFADVSNPANWSRSGLEGGTPGLENFSPPQIVDVTLLEETGPGSTWKIRKGYDDVAQALAPFSTPTTAWRELGHDDASWLQGAAPIGYGEVEIATVLSDMDNRYAAFACRRIVEVSQEALDEMLGVTFSAHVDDGFVVYWNGEEIGRIGLTGDPGTEVTYDALATSARELKSARPVTYQIPREKVHVGANLLAVQVHNRRLTEASGDAGFSAGLTYQKRVIFAPPPARSVVINEVISRGSLNRGVEIFNTLGMVKDLSGWQLAPNPERSSIYTFPPGASIPARGHLFVTEAALGFTLGGPEVRVLLYEADGKTPADALTVEDPDPPTGDSQSHVRSPDGSSSLWISTAPTPGAPNQVTVEDGVVINEIHYSPKILLPTGQPDPDETRGEFIELFNRSARTISLEGWRLASGYNYAFPAGTSLAAGAYLVIGRNPAYLRETYGLAPEVVLGPPAGATPGDLAAFGALKNGGERVRLVDPIGNTADEVDYQTEGEWPELADGGGSSLELIDPYQDNLSPSAWAPSDERKKAPWIELTHSTTYSTNLIPAPQESELHIYFVSEGEMILDAVSVTQGDPPVETIPNGGFETDTRPWRLIGTHVRSFRTTDEAKEGSAALHVVATGSGDNRVNRIELDTNPALKNGAVNVKFWARWVAGCNAIHVSGHNNAFATTMYLPLHADTGTPGAENSARKALRTATGSDNLGPVISRVLHSPAVPTTLEPIHIRAQVTDPDGVASVEAKHQKDGTTEFTSTQLFDDGAHDDELPNDGLYGGDLPGYPAKTLVNFYVEAKDTGGRSRTFPPDISDHTLLFSTDDRLSSPLLRYRVLINQKELNTPVTGLARRLLHSDELVHGTFVFEESEVYYDVGLRYHGSPWNRPPDPKMFRVRFNGDKPFLDGAKRINISRYGSVQNEGTAYQLLTRAGREGVTVPHTQRYQYITVKLNNAPHGSGALADLRPIDGEYFSFNWPNDDGGQAWKFTGKLAFSDAGTMAGGGPDWSVLKAYTTGPYPGNADHPENYRFYYNPQVRLDADEFGPIIKLLKTMDRATTPDAQYESEIVKILNIESSLRVFAIRSFLADWDTIDIGNGQNGYIYFAPIEGRHYLVPWDMDHTFERTDVAIAPGSSTNGFRRLLSRPVFRRQYARIIRELLDTSWSEEYTSNWVDLVGQTAVPGKVAAGTGLLGFMRTRRTMAETFLKSSRGVPFALTSSNPSGGPDGKVTLNGTAGVEVSNVLVRLNGGDLVELEPTWSAPTRPAGTLPTLWQVTVSGLKAGKNEAELFGFDDSGNLVGSFKVDLYDTTGWAAPTLASLDPSSGPVAGGTPLTVHGTGFQIGLQIKVSGKPCTEVTLVSPAEASALVPAGTTAGVVDVAVTNIDGQAANLAGAFTYTEGAPFKRGDADRNGRLDTTDAVVALEYMFRGGSLGCVDAADANDDGQLNLTDPIVLLRYLFQGGSPPPAPLDEPGQDPTADGLSCEA